MGSPGDEPALKPVICHECFNKTKAAEVPNMPCPHAVAMCQRAADAARKSQMDADVAYKNSCLLSEREHCALIVEDPIEELKVEAKKIDQSGGNSSSTRHLWAALLSRADAIRNQPSPGGRGPNLQPPTQCPTCQDKKIKECTGHHPTPLPNGMRFWRCTECHHHWEAR